MPYYFQDQSVFSGKYELSGFKIGIDDEFYSLLNEAYGLVGRLNGTCQFVPNLDYYAKLLMIEESCASCELDHIHVRFYDYFNSEEKANDLQFAVNHLKAVEYANNNAFSSSLLKTVHGILASGNIKESKYRSRSNIVSGEFYRRSDPERIYLSEIIPAIKEIKEHLTNANYHNGLMAAAKIQYQLEILAPFDRYNKIIARIIAMRVLKWAGLLDFPVLGLSNYFLDLKTEYNDRIDAAYRHDEGLLDVMWVKFFIKAVNESAKKSINLIESLANARRTHMAMLPKISNGSKSIQAIYDYISETIIVNVRQISDVLGLSFGSVSKVMKIFEKTGIIRMLTSKERYRQYGYIPILDLIDIR